MELIVSKTLLDDLQDLGKSFLNAIQRGGLSKPDLVAPYIVENETGFAITLNLKNGNLNLHSAHFPSIDSSENDTSTNGMVLRAPVSTDFDASCKISAGGKAKKAASMSVINPLNDDSQKAISVYVQVSGRLVRKDFRKVRIESLSNHVTVNLYFYSAQIGDIENDIILPVHKADRRYFPLYRDTKQPPLGIISHVKNEYGVVKVIHLTYCS